MTFLAIVGAVILMAASAPAGITGITDPSCRGILHGVAKNAGNQPVPGIRLVLWPIGVDLDYVLPTATSNEAGTYSFEHVCAGRFTVLLMTSEPDTRRKLGVTCWAISARRR